MTSRSVSRNLLTAPRARLAFFFGLCAALLLALLVPALSSQQSSHSAAGWRPATPAELKTIIPERAPVLAERIETEERTASGITNNKGKFVAGVVLITAGYSADGKYSHFLLTQVPLRIGGSALAPGNYLIGWTRGESKLAVTVYEASNGKPAAQIDATQDPEIHRVESFRISPPSAKPYMQLGRFTFPYSIGEN